MLDEAKQRLREILHRLQPAIEAGTPIIVLEPSCLAVFRDELPGLFPSSEDGKRLRKQAQLLSEFLTSHVKDYQPPQIEQPAIVQFHCHHRSVMGADTEQQLLDRLGLKVEVPELGCCGMAGSFGFEPGDHYRVSQACGERHLLPAVRQADGETLIIADGFSCREQIAQGTGRRALHLAEVLALAGRSDGRGPRPLASEQRRSASSSANLIGTAAAAAAITLAAGTLVWWLQQRRES
jgi:Fe-S oxidoreductase